MNDWIYTTTKEAPAETLIEYSAVNCYGGIESDIGMIETVTGLMVKADGTDEYPASLIYAWRLYQKPEPARLKEGKEQ